MMNIHTIGLRQRVGYNFSMAIFRVPFKTQKTAFGVQNFLPGLLQRQLSIGCRQMPRVYLSEFGKTAGASRVAAGFGVAKRLNMKVANSGGFKSFVQRFL